MFFIIDSICSVVSSICGLLLFYFWKKCKQFPHTKTIKILSIILLFNGLILILLLISIISIKIGLVGAEILFIFLPYWIIRTVIAGGLVNGLGIVISIFLSLSLIGGTTIYLLNVISFKKNKSIVIKRFNVDLLLIWVIIRILLLLWSLLDIA